MKSPNSSLTSRFSASLANVRKSRTLCTAVAMTLFYPLLFAACQSSDYSRTRASKGDNPYAKNEPKTTEEEEYYRDVYSGDWSEDSHGGLASVYKNSGSVTMPKHWRSAPPGAKTLEEIRFETAQRKAVETRLSGRTLPPPSASHSTSVASSATAPEYAAQTPSQVNYGATSVPATTPAPIANPSAPLAQPFSAASPIPPQPNVYAQGSISSPVAPSLGPQFVAQAPSRPQTQPSSQPTVQTPNVQTPAIQVPATQESAVYPQPQPSVYPSGNISASVDIMGEWLVRGQEPEEEASFFDDESKEEQFVEEEAEEDKDAVDVPLEIADEKQKEEKPVAQISADNVNVKSIAPDARVVVPDAPVETASILAGIYNGLKKLPLKIDPSIALPFSNVHRPTDALSSTDKNQERGKYDEYVVTGGDSKAQVFSREDWSVENLDAEDTAAHFDTIDGRILAEPSNRVFLYSPRFGAVRQIVGPIEGDHREGVEIANTNEGALQGEEVVGVDVRTQEIRPLGANNTEQPQGAETTVGITVSTGLQGVMEGDSQIRLGAMLMSETVDGLSSEDASLMLDGVIAAQGWSGELGVAVSTELVNAFSNAYIDGAATVYHIKDDTKTSKLRVIKIANKEAAKPGEFVEFTLRFENIGDQPIGNVTILDNLSSRLRYVDGTAQSSVQADFLAELNERGSLVLRWEIEKPLLPKEFGVARFICKVQ